MLRLVYVMSGVYFRDAYFMMGESNEKKSNLDDVAGLTPDPR